MIKKNILSAVIVLFTFFSNLSSAVPIVTGQPVDVQHLGIIDWPQDEAVVEPYLTQAAANDLNDLHGDVACDVIISTPGNYHMALKDAMKGRPDLGHIGLQTQVQLNAPAGTRISVCWSTSPPVAVEQIANRTLQFKNLHLEGRPTLAVGPNGVMDQLILDDSVNLPSVAPLLTNKGNVILIRAEKAGLINNVCDLGGTTRVVTPNPVLEPGSFSNFSATIFDVANLNSLSCDATALFNSIFSQDISLFDLTALDNPYDINAIMSVFGRGTSPQGNGAKWVASSRIMHRDIPYALCNDQADAAVIFYHQATYLKKTLASSGCDLKIVPMGGTVANPQPVPGNKVGALKIAKVKGNFAPEIKSARTLIHDFLTTSPIWGQILADHGMTQ